jgi:hypothetical protein
LYGAGDSGSSKFGSAVSGSIATSLLTKDFIKNLELLKTLFPRHLNILKAIISKMIKIIMAKAETIILKPMESNVLKKY